MYKIHDSVSNIGWKIGEFWVIFFQKHFFLKTSISLFIHGDQEILKFNGKTIQNVRFIPFYFVPLFQALALLDNINFLTKQKLSNSYGSQF